MPLSLFYFPQRTKHIISILSYLLAYFSDEGVDEPILWFLSILSSEEGTLVIFYYAHFLADTIHEQFLQFLTKGMFIYSFVLIHMFIFFQIVMFPFAVLKHSEQGEPKSIIFGLQSSKRIHRSTGLKTLLTSSYIKQLIYWAANKFPVSVKTFKRCFTSVNRGKQVIGIYTKVIQRSWFMALSYHPINYQNTFEMRIFSL